MRPLHWLRGWPLIVVGALLLLSPLAASTLPLGGFQYHHSVEYVEVTADGIDGTGTVTLDELDSDILCWRSFSRSCQLERALLAEPLDVDPGADPYTHASPYQFVYANATFYEISNTGLELRLEAVNNASALERAAGTGGAVPDRVHRQLREGVPIEDGVRTVSARTRLPTNELIALGGDRYAVLGPAEETRDATFLRVVLGAGGFLVGLVLVLRGQRHRVGPV